MLEIILVLIFVFWITIFPIFIVAGLLSGIVVGGLIVAVIIKKGYKSIEGREKEITKSWFYMWFGMVIVFIIQVNGYFLYKAII